MKFSRLIPVSVLVFIWFTAGAANSGDQTGVGGPAAVVNERTHFFSDVPEGTRVVHDFIIENRGNENLEIKKVKTG